MLNQQQVNNAKKSLKTEKTGASQIQSPQIWEELADSQAENLKGGLRAQGYW